MGIGVLGPLTVDGSATGIGPRDRVVLSALALHPGDVVSAERLADALWGEHPPASGGKIVQGCIVRLRRRLGASTIETTTQGYRLVVSGGDVDAQQFERLLRRARELLTLGEPEHAAFVADEALALWRGRALVDLEDWEAGRIEAGRLEQMRLDAEELRIDATLRAGRYREVLSEARALVTRAPLRERRWALLALAEYQAGRQAESLRTLRQARTMLANELGLDPGPDLVALEQAILRQDPSLLTEALPEPSATCPYQGLLPYGIEDADNFFGRDEDVSSCLRRLAGIGSLTVAGPSGSGKSSLVRAGVAAALQRDGRRVVVVTPGLRPLDALTAVGTNGVAPLLVVDQCEEAITLCESEDERARFFAALAAHTSRAPVVIAVRADHLGAFSEYPEFAQLVERSLYLLRPLGEQDLRAAIEGPARQHGLLLEPGLVDLLIREAEGEPGALPLLSHALSQTWARREGRTLTVEGYRETGGIRGAVAQSAEHVYEQVAPEQRATLRDLLLRLVTPTPEGEPVRSRVPLRMVAASPDHERLIGLLVNARLVTSDEGALELSHEALIRAWPRLQTWLDDDVQGQRILRHVSVAADTWDGMGQPDSELYRGTRLAQALQWQQATRPDLNATERDFLAASGRLAEVEQRTAEERVRQQARVNRRLRGLLAGAGVLLVCALIAGLLAVREADRADEAAVAADARRVGAQALVAEDPDDSLLLAVEGVRLDDSRDTQANLLAAMSRTPALVATLRTHAGIISAAVSPDNRMVAVTHSWADVEFFDIDTKESLGRYDELTAASRVAFRPDGKQLAVGNQPDPAEPTTFDPTPLRLVDPTTFAEQPVQLGGQPERAFTYAPDYSADGRFLAASFGIVVDPNADALSEPESSRLVVWDVTKPEQPVTSIDLPNFNYYPALSPDGSVVYVGHLDPSSVTAYDVASGRELMSSALPGWILTLSPDGTVLAAGDGAEISLIDAATLQERIRLRRHTGNLGDVEFSADGALLASGADDNTALVWDVASGEIRQELNGHSGGVWGLAFTSDGSLVTSSLDETVHFWDIEGTRRFISRSPSAQPLPIDDAWAFPSNDVIANARLEMPDAPGQPASAVLFRDVATGRVTALDTRHGSGHWFAWGPDGRRFASVGSDQFVRVWDWPTLQLVTEQQVLQDDAVDVDFTGDGTRLVVAERGGRVLTLDAENLKLASPTIRLDTELNAIKASPDNRTAIVFTSGYDYVLVDIDEGRVLRRGEIDIGPLPGANGEFSPDGRRVAVTEGRRVRVMDVASGDWLGPAVLARINTISYAPDGSTFATGGTDGAVSLWDGNTGSLLGTVVPGAFEPDLWAHFLPDGHTVLIATHGGDVYTWDTRPEHWVNFACQVVGRNLTTEEWTAVFDDRPYRKTCPNN